MIAEETGANILQEVEMTAISTEMCESLWSPFGVDIDDSRICFYNGKRSACQVGS